MNFLLFFVGKKKAEEGYINAQDRQVLPQQLHSLRRDVTASDVDNHHQSKDHDQRARDASPLLPPPTNFIKLTEAIWILAILYRTTVPF
jgi:hypothetical protein